MVNKNHHFLNYDILFNGYTVITVNTLGYIFHAGFGVLFNNGLSNLFINISNPVKNINAKYTSDYFLSVKYLARPYPYRA